MAALEKPKESRLMDEMRRLLGMRESGIFIALVVFFTIMVFISPAFRTEYNLIAILKQISVTTIVACGQTLVIISGAFDLSQGAVAGLAAMIAALSVKGLGLPPFMGIIIGLMVGLACGLVNGVLMARFRLHPIVLTLATATMFQGLTYFITRGNPVVALPEQYLWLGKGQIGAIPVPVILMLVVVVAMHILLTRSVFGLRVLMIGGNAEASRLSGVHVERVRIGIFMISGFLAALGGLVVTGRVGNALPTIGQDLLFPVVTAAILGGTLLSGGVGSMAGTFMGAGVAGIVNNAMVLLQFNIFLQDVAQGLLVLVALLIDQFRRGELTWKKLMGKD